MTCLTIFDVLWPRAKADQENDGWPGPRTDSHFTGQSGFLPPLLQDASDVAGWGHQATETPRL